MKICLSRWCFMVSYGTVYLSKIHYLCLSSGILKQEEKIWEDRKDYRLNSTNIGNYIRYLGLIFVL